MRRRPTGDEKSTCTELARRHIANPLRCRGGTHRAFAAIGKGRERDGVGIYRSHDR